MEKRVLLPVLLLLALPGAFAADPPAASADGAVAVPSAADATEPKTPVPAAEPAAGLTPSAAEQALDALVDRQKTLLAGAAAGGADFDQEKFRKQMQDLANDYDDYLKRNPDYAPAYAAYGVMLEKISMRREGVRILLKGNELFEKEAQDPAVRTPAFLHAWALVKNELGNYVAEEGTPLEAVNYYLSAIDLVPDEPLYHYQLGKLLTDARDDFIQSGQWTRAALDKAMHEAFRRAAELAPARIEFTYRYAESFYDLREPDWDGALEAWAALERQATTEVDRQIMRLQTANVLIKDGKSDKARAVLATVTKPELDKQKRKLADLLAAAPTGGAR